MLPLHLLSGLFCAVLVTGQLHTSEVSGEEEDQGLYLNSTEVFMLCMKDTTLGDKLAQAFGMCMGAPTTAAGRTLDLASLRQRPQPGGKGKQTPPPPPCPTFKQAMAMVKVRFQSLFQFTGYFFLLPG
jgi:hypothetical protein